MQENMQKQEQQQNLQIPTKHQSSNIVLPRYMKSGASTGSYGLTDKKGTFTVNDETKQIEYTVDDN